jgi:uncharacterized membrane protein YtjA (UPF0391 family)
VGSGQSWPASARPVGAATRERAKAGEVFMLRWTLTFLVIAIIAALLGFTGIAGAAAGIAKILFTVFLVIFLLSLVFGLMRA